MSGRSLLLAASGLLMVAALYLALVWSPPDLNLGDTVRIFYFHVPLAWVAFLAFGIVFVASIAYLWKGGERWDSVAYCAAEMGVVLTTLTLITGSIWGKVAWGVWWTWEPRLTTTLILWLIYVGYLMLRAYAPEGGQGSRYAAVLGVVGFVDVPIVFFSVNWWRGNHPVQVVGPNLNIEGSMLAALLVSLAAFTLLFVFLLLERYSLRRAEETLERVQLPHV
ncbi:MAG: cytochrome c biogenesis protein CcsA [Chloroflexi bacterium]|nr:cytochrome c biogenesis protein CcsA [Chloroflexota bacterium]